MKSKLKNAIFIKKYRSRLIDKKNEYSNDQIVYDRENEIIDFNGIGHVRFICIENHKKYKRVEEDALFAFFGNDDDHVEGECIDYRDIKFNYSNTYIIK